jgi:hypothetical protein
MLVFISETYSNSHNSQQNEMTRYTILLLVLLPLFNLCIITECAANFLKFAPERIGGGGRGDN